MPVDVDQDCPRLGFLLEQDLVLLTPEDLCSAIVLILVKANMFEGCEIDEERGWWISFIDHSGKKKRIYLPNRVVRGVKISKQRIAWPLQLGVTLSHLLFGFSTDYLYDGQYEISFPKQNVTIVLARSSRFARV